MNECDRLVWDMQKFSLDKTHEIELAFMTNIYIGHWVMTF